MTAEMLPPLPAIGSVQIEIFGPTPGAAKWDLSQWDVDIWADVGWRNVTPQAMIYEGTWGADQPQGALTVCAAGSWSIKTYDPDRLLDPSNGASPYVASLRPGRPMRVIHVDPVNFAVTIVRQGLIDSVEYNLIEKTGTISGTDSISIMAQANLPEGQHLDPLMPQTLRARARYLLQLANLHKIIDVESDGADPLVGYPGRALNGEIAPPPRAYYGYGEDEGNFLNMTDEADWPGVPGGTVNRVGPLAGTDGAANGDGSTISYGNIFNDNSDLYTIMAWVVWDGAGEFYIWDKIKVRAAGGYTGWRVQIGTDGSLRMLLTDPATGAMSTTQSDGGAVQAGVKCHVAFTRNATETSLYVNGMLVKVGAPGPSPVGQDSTMASRTLLSGTLDEYGLWQGTCMTIEQINAIYTTDEVLLIDPPVGPVIESEASVWNHILNAAYDALYAVWMDRNGVMRFRSFGNPQDDGFTVGVGGVPIENIDIAASLDGVHTRVVGYDVTAPETPVEAFDATKASIYGTITLHRQAPVPNANTWVNNVLLDRSGAALQYLPRTIYPQTADQLRDILALGMVDIMHVGTDAVDPPINVATRVLGSKIVADTGTGWTAEIVSYIPANEWEDQETIPPEPEEPPDPTDPPTKEVVRYYDCVKDAVGAKEPGGRNYGAGTDGELPVGAWMGWKFRAFFDFEDIDFSDVVGDVVQAAIEVDTTTQVQVGFGSTPKVVIKRVTESWSEGNRDHPSYDNALIYPGPSCTSTNSKTIAVPDAENRAVELLITQMVRDWQHGSKQYGVGMFSAGEDSEKYTTEFWARTNSTTGKRPRLRLTVKVPA